MKILFLVPNPIGTIPGQRFRFEHYLPFLSKEGVYYKVCPFVYWRFHKILYKKGQIIKKCLYTLLGFSYRILNLFQSCRYDLVYVYREITPLGPPIFETLLYFMGKPIIYDFDDAIYLPASSKVNKFISFLKFPQKTKYIIKLSRLVLAGNKTLKDYSLRFNKNVAVLPTVIDTDLYQPKINQNKDTVCLGWSGSLTTIPHLGLIKEVLKKIYLKYKVDIKIIGSKDFFITGVKIFAQDWKLDSELKDLRKIDIGLMPLPDDEWGKGKCGLKALQYMALSIPAVCSPVGVNSEIIDDGINGFLCRNEEEWVEKLSLLINNRELCNRIGLEGRRTVERRYSVKVNAPFFLDILKKTYDDARK